MGPPVSEQYRGRMEPHQPPPFTDPVHPGPTVDPGEMCCYVQGKELHAAMVEKQLRVEGKDPAVSWDVTPHVSLWDGTGHRLADAYLRGPARVVHQQLTGLVAAVTPIYVTFSMDTYYHPGPGPAPTDLRAAWLSGDGPVVVEAIQVVTALTGCEPMGWVSSYRVVNGPSVEWLDHEWIDTIEGSYPDAITTGHALPASDIVLAATRRVMAGHGTVLRARPAVLESLGLTTTR